MYKSEHKVREERESPKVDIKMVAYKKIDENLSIAGQIFVSSLEVLKGQGFTTIMCNRPDYEEDIEDQPLSSEIESRAVELGMQFVYIPIDDSGPTLQAVEQTRKALDGAEGPVFAYCLSGMRSMTLTSLAKALDGRATTDELISKAKTHGYNLSRFRPTLEFVAA